MITTESSMDLIYQAFLAVEWIVGGKVLEIGRMI